MNNTNKPIVTTFDGTQFPPPEIVNYASPDADHTVILAVRRNTGYKQATGDNLAYTTERHDIDSFVALVADGCTYSQSYVQRWPRQFPLDHPKRNAASPRQFENAYVDGRANCIILTLDDDSKKPGVIDRWFSDPFFGQHGSLFIESSSSLSGAEKGHPVLWLKKTPAFDNNPQLLQDCIKAFQWHYKATTDAAPTSTVSLLFNKIGANIHPVGTWDTPCKFNVFNRVILRPYIEAQDALRLRLETAAKNAVPFVGDAAEYLNATIASIAADLAATTESRHKPLYMAAARFGSLIVAGWTDDVSAEMPQAIIDACIDNGYVAEYGEASMTRAWHDGVMRGSEHPATPPPGHRPIGAVADNVPATFAPPGTLGTAVSRSTDTAVDLDLDFKLMADYTAKRLSGDVLATDLFTVEPTAEYFSGEYPPNETIKTCSNHWCTKNIDYNVSRIMRQPWDNWRGFMSRGIYVPPCEHCRRQRVLQYCEKIIAACNNTYQFSNLMTFCILDNADAKRLTGKLKKQRQRNDPHLSYAISNIGNGRSVVLHDAVDEEGTPIPADMAELFNLVGEWVLNTPKGHRAFRGLGTWGNQTSKRGGNEVTDKSDNDKSSNEVTWGIYGVDWHKMRLAVRAFFDEDLPAGNFEPKDLSVIDMIKALDAAGEQYRIKGIGPRAGDNEIVASKKLAILSSISSVDGDLSPIADKKKKIPVNGDTTSKNTPPQACFRLDEVAEAIKF